MVVITSLRDALCRALGRRVFGVQSGGKEGAREAEQPPATSTHKKRRGVGGSAGIILVAAALHRPRPPAARGAGLH